MVLTITSKSLLLILLVYSHFFDALNANSFLFSRQQSLSPRGFGLINNRINDDLTSSQILSKIAPNIKNCALVLKSKSTQQNSETLSYKIFCNDIEIYQSHFSVNKINGIIDFLSLNIDNLSFPKLINQKWVDPKKIAINGVFLQANKILYPYKNQLVYAWEVNFYNNKSNSSHTWIVDAFNSKILQKINKNIHAVYAEVYDQNQNDPFKVERELPFLGSSPYLDGSYFSVFTDNPNSSRVQSIGRFFSSPDSASDHHDQLQAYYAATQVLKWWQSEFSYQADRLPIHIHVRSAIAGSKNNAAFIPFAENQLPKIILGEGDNVNFRNFAKDNDIMAHELHHYFFYNHILADNPPQVMIHEGLADYFTYVMTDSPLLAESIKIGASYLRTAILSNNDRIDNTGISRSPHLLGQYLSASLWQLGQSIDDFHHTVLAAMKYINPKAELKELLQALLLADRDRAPRDSSDPLYEIFGSNHCEIIEELLSRGFARYIENIDGSTCGFDLAQLGAESRTKKAEIFDLSLNSLADYEEKDGSSCGTLSATPKQKPFLLYELIFLMPLILLLPFPAKTNYYPFIRT